MAENKWEDLYLVGDTQWDKGEASPGLVDFLAARKVTAGQTVLIPGCGTGHDVRAWAQAGFLPTGLDIAPTAQRVAREKTEAAGLKADFRLADFLRDEPFHRFDLVFEHTLYCAINPDQRDDYVRSVRRWLKDGGTYIAIFFMLPEDEKGPPFGTTREEIRRRFDSSFELVEEWVPRSWPNRTGLEWMTRWTPRS